MKLISWNIRGLNGPRKTRLLKNMLKQENPQVLFLQEIKCDSSVLDRIANKFWPRSHNIAVDANGASGGLAILWDSRATELTNFHAHRNFLQATFHILGTNQYGLLTNVYFPQETQRKEDILNSISALNQNRPLPLWIAGGYFNMITRMDERRGGTGRSSQEGSLLKDFIQNNWLIDLPFNNGVFTWKNTEAQILQISSQLDRFLLSNNAIHLGGDFAASILPFTGSDHWPISLHWSRPRNNTRRPFLFEAFSLTHPDFHKFISTEWKIFHSPPRSRMFQFQQKLKYLKGKIEHWNRTTFGNIFQGKANIEQDMKQLQQKIITLGRSDDLAEQEKTLELKLMEKEKQEETLWRKKSRIKWLKEGEKNTKFFHNTTIQQRMHNNITHIQNEQGTKVEKHEDIEAELLNYFKQGHREPTNDRSQAIQNITRNIPKLITYEHNQMLLKSVDLQEVETTVKQLNAGKARGPDGFTSNFFHNFSDLIKNEVWQVVEESRSLRWMCRGINATFIAVIPKVEKPCKLDKFKLIALCNIIYKIVSKIIATRLKLLLPLIISPEQSGYVEGRQITDEIILTHEIIHSLNISKKRRMLLKLDLSKAFDRLIWNYIEKILLDFGFNASWVRWIMSLITFSFFYVLINGIPSETFHPTRGIRQGDPLSPFLFIIMVEGLGRSIKHAQQTAHLKGLSFHNSPVFTHQQFVDDNMLYEHPLVQEARHLKSLLSDFSAASAKLPSSYLGAPLIASILKHSSWRSLLDKLEARLSSWTHRSLNMASRLVLIKVVLQDMPLYLFSILAAPKWVLKELKAIQRAFLSGNSGLHRKWALVKSETACLPKKGGGIGLRDPTHSNVVMGARIWWKWLSGPPTPWAILWTTKYVGNCPREELIRISEICNGSIIWNSAKLHRNLIEQHSFWDVKSGDKARFWDDSWQQSPKLRELFPHIAPPKHCLYPLNKVGNFWSTTVTQDYREWLKASQIIAHGTIQE
eukprot:PITA_02817